MHSQKKLNLQTKNCWRFIMTLFANYPGGLILNEGDPVLIAGHGGSEAVLGSRAVNKKAVMGLADFFRQSWALGSAGVRVPLRILQETQIRDIDVQSTDRYQFLKVSRQR
jgi:hypothetical protein